MSSICCWADGGSGNRCAGGHAMGLLQGNGGNTGVTSGQVGAGGSDITGEFEHGRGKKQTGKM